MKQKGCITILYKPKSRFVFSAPFNNQVLMLIAPVSSFNKGNFSVKSRHF